MGYVVGDYKDTKDDECKDTDESRCRTMDDGDCENSHIGMKKRTMVL
jgi:hypothetical protein